MADPTEAQRIHAADQTKAAMLDLAEALGAFYNKLKKSPMPATLARDLTKQWLAGYCAEEIQALEGWEPE